MEARGTIIKLTRTTIAFEVYNPNSIIQLSEVLQDFTIYHRDQPVYQGRAVVSTLVNTGLMLIVSATLVDRWLDTFDTISKPEALRESAENFIHDWDETHKLVPSFQLVVSEMRSFFSEMNRWLSQVTISEQDEEKRNPDIQQDFINTIEPPLLEKTFQYWERFETEAKKIPSEHSVSHKRYVQTDLHPMIMTAPFVHRTYHKPLGYAGDYEMVNMLLRTPYEGPSIYAKLINKAFILEGMGRAHRNRIDILEQTLFEVAKTNICQNRKKRILNIGCGPAVEVQRLIEDDVSEHLEFKLLDFNHETLAYTEKKLSQILRNNQRNVEIEYIQQSVYSLLKQPKSGGQLFPNNHFDMVYCAGLFDYLSDKICSRLIELFYQWAKHDGIVLLTNVHPLNPGINVMEYILEWHLVYRDEKQMSNLYNKTNNKRVFTDETGFNVFLEINKT
ncbi:MAG: class I SAM-dependent methyltransferase [Pseudomonadota bacterium]